MTNKWAWPGSPDPMSKIWDAPYNFLNKLTYLLQIWYRDGAQILPAYENEPKMTHKWAWPGSPDPISKLWDPLITGKTSKVNYRYINNNKTGNKRQKPKVYNDV